jgi:hypothetical protein
MPTLKFGFILPFLDARVVASLAYEAESVGWDGIFVPEAVWHLDAWVSLAAAAMRTERIRLGTMLTPLPRMRPWKLAAESTTLDRLCNGRLILSLGMGAVWMGYQAFPDEVTNTRTRAELLDEGIDVLNLLYRGEQVRYDGKHYHVDLASVDPQHYPPPPLQQPRIPLWVVGVWPRMKSMQRVLACDGLLPNKMNPDGQLTAYTPEDIRQMKAYVDANRTLTTPFDIVVDGKLLDLDPAQRSEALQPWIEAGATWWLEAPVYGEPHDQLLARIRQGPPRLA